MTQVGAAAAASTEAVPETTIVRKESAKMTHVVKAVNPNFSKLWSTGLYIHLSVPGVLYLVGT